MNRHLKEVNGGERNRGDGCSLDALIEFYRAFNAGDLAGLEEVWLGGSEPSMDNPIGGIRRGWDQIVDGYSKLFKGQAKVHVTFDLDNWGWGGLPTVQYRKNKAEGKA
nr:nuclear transport factor 2 family protein [Rhizobium laguerreae]